MGTRHTEAPGIAHASPPPPPRSGQPPGRRLPALSAKAPGLHSPPTKILAIKPPRPQVAAQTPAKPPTTGVAQVGSRAPRPGPPGPPCCPKPRSAGTRAASPLGPYCCGSRRPEWGAGDPHRHSPPARRLRAAAGQAGPRGRAFFCARLGGVCGGGAEAEAGSSRQARAPQTRSYRASVFSGGGASSLRSRSAPESVPLPARAPGRPDGKHAPPTGKFRWEPAEAGLRPALGGL